jgi:prevent-host-death family protein
MAGIARRAAKNLSATEAREKFSEVVNRVRYGRERILLGRHGNEQAAIVPVEDLRLIEQLEDALDLSAAREALRETGTVSWKKLRAELGI